MQVKTKILNKDIETPPLKYAKDGDAGIDLVATSKTYDKNGNILYGTNRAFEIPKGYAGLLFPRSSNNKQDLLLTNSVGLLDSGYRGEVMMSYKVSPSARKTIRVIEAIVSHKTKDNTGVNDMSTVKSNVYGIGDRIGQLVIMPYPSIEFVESDDLSETERGAGGFGSTDVI